MTSKTNTLWIAPYTEHPITGKISVPGSKSETNRALILAALANDTGTITGALKSRDTQLMIDALRQLGVGVTVGSDVIRIDPPSQFQPVPTGIDCGLAGTVMRFVPALAVLAPGKTRFFGDIYAANRPIEPLIKGLRQLGISCSDTKLPFIMECPRHIGTTVKIDASSSSQFISAFLLAGSRYPKGLQLAHTGSQLPSRPHIEMTLTALSQRGVSVDVLNDNNWSIKHGPINAITAAIEPDLTNAAVFLAAAAITSGHVSINGWPTNSSQPGVQFRDILAAFGVTSEQKNDCFKVFGPEILKPVDLDLRSVSELTPVVAAMALFAQGESRIRGVAHIRRHESDRIAVLVKEFNNLGIKTYETSDGLIINGIGKNVSNLSPKIFHTYDDHRIAHVGALIGLKIKGLTLDDVSCTSKTMPDFTERWMKLLGTL